MFILSWFNQNLIVRKLLSLLLLAGALFISLLYATSHVQADDPGSMDAPTTISGRVTNQQGQALADINVTVYRMYDGNGSPVRVVSTTVDGSYKALGLSAGTYRVSFVDPKEQYAAFFYRSGTTIDDGEDVVITGFSVIGINGNLPPSAHITGSVTIAGEERATSGEVAIWHEANGYWSRLKSTTIQPNGTYEIAGLAAGVYRIGANYEELFGVYEGKTIEDAADVTVTTSQIISNVNIVVGLSQYNGVISGTVTDDGNSLAGIRIDIDTEVRFPFSETPHYVYSYTNAQGKYSINGLPDGYYFVRFSDPTEQYAATYFGASPLSYSPNGLRIRNGMAFSNTNASLVKGGKIKGNIYRYDGQPISDVVVSLSATIDDNLYYSAPVAIATTNQSGNYTFTAVAPGVYVILFRHPFYGVEYYGGFEEPYPEFPGLYSPTPITVSVGETISHINQILGPDYVVNLPLISR